RPPTGPIIESQSEVGGRPGFDAGTPSLDSDGEGMPDEWERAQRLDPAHPADGSADRDGDGFTNLEDWLNSL
ncbi:MAG: pectate lyase, partial [bacterium]